MIVIAVLGLAFPADAQQATLPTITFLGEGPQTFTIEPPLKFVVKTYQGGEFTFITVEDTTYTARRNERVWSTDNFPTSGVRLFDEWISYGNYNAGCRVDFVMIEDNVDTRRNTFYINGEALLTVDQGMVVYGSFTIPETGELTFFAEDSVGMIVTPCIGATTDVPTQTVEGTVTSTVETPTAPTVTLTGQPTVTNTVVATTPVGQQTVTNTVVATTPVGQQTEQVPTATLTLQQTLTGSPTVTLAPSLTPTPTGTITVTPLASPTRTPTQRLTPVTIPPTGGGPGPREIASMSAMLLGGLTLVGAAWWSLLRWRRHE